MSLILAGAMISPSAFSAIKIQNWQTNDGARVLFVENHSLPMLDVAVDFAAGAAYDQPGESGLAYLTQRMLRFGAGGLSEGDIARKLADVGAQLDGRFDKDRAAMTLRTLSSARERDQALDVMALVLQKPDIPEKVIGREKNRIVAGLKEAETRPEAIAEKAFYSALYGEHPYALHQSGEVATVSQLARADVKNFYDSRYHAKRAVVSIVGDVSRAQAEAIAEKLTGQLPDWQGEGKTLPEVTPPARHEMQKIPHPATQSHILIGSPAMERGDADYFPLYVGNYILGGGGFVSRLTEEVREKRGLAYSVYSYFLPLQELGPFQIGLQTKKEQSDDALKVVRDTLKKFVAQGPTERELKAAKQNLIGGFPLRVDSNKVILEYLAVIGFYRLPLTYLDDFTKNVEKVTVKEIKDAFRRRINPDELQTVVVGASEEKPIAAK
ncbi:MAG: M16 family metallopeptidase [Burkholderiales bacterium]